MKKITLLTSILLILGLGLSAQNLIIDGGFETQDKTLWAGSTDDLKWNINSDLVISDTVTARLAGAARAAAVYQSIAVEAGATYDFSFKTNITDSLQRVVGEVSASIEAPFVFDSLFSTSSDTTVTVSGQYTVPQGVDTIHVQFRKSGGIAFFDDVYFGKVETSAIRQVENKKISSISVSAGKQINMSCEQPILSYSIYAISGKKVMQDSQLSAKSVSVNANQLNGIYIVSIQAENGTYNNHKLLIK